MIFCIMGKGIAEQKYIQLANERSGIAGWFGYNPLDHSDSTLNKAANNVTRMNNLLSNYTKVYAA